MKRISVLVGAALLLPSCVAVNNVEAPMVGAVPEGMVTMTAEDVVAGRRSAFFLSTRAVAQIKQGLSEGGNLRLTRGGAIMLSRWAETLPKMFPEGSQSEESRALDTVWTDRAGFEARAEDYRNAAIQLAQIAETGDREAANAAFMTMANACQSCHQSYREPDEPR